MLKVGRTKKPTTQHMQSRFDALRSGGRLSGLRVRVLQQAQRLGPSGSAEVLRVGVSLTALIPNLHVALPMELTAALPSHVPLPRRI